jgi:hypothetical protein
MTISSDLSRGRYRAVLDLCCENQVPDLSVDRPKLIVDKLSIQRRATVGLAIVEVAEPPVPALHWALLVDDLAGGARGVISTEDRGRYAIASRIVTEGESGVAARIDPRSGIAMRYRLEPYALTVSAGDRAVAPSVPNIIFRFPSGSLRVEIRAPDGSVRRIGPYPFVQSRSRTPTNRSGRTLDAGGGHLTDAYQLSTMRPEMELTFDRDGEYTITLEGEIEDIHGNVWRGGGTYPVMVGTPLIIDPAALPGTPFEAGDTLATGATIIPPVAADVDVRLRFAPRSDPARMIERVFSGRANRSGYFHAEPFTFTEPGEYRLDITARYRDERGALWYGQKTSGSAVAPVNASLLAHGRRGDDSMPNERPQWFARRSDGSSHVHIPWAIGDVLWQTKEDAALPIVTVQDPSGRVSSVLRARTGATDFNERVTRGEIALFSSRGDRVDPYIDPSRIDLWGYSYRSVQRPLVRVREQIGEQVNSLYWRFRENYAGQHGTGSAGDLPNDFKFQYGAAVLHGTGIGEPEYAIYGSLFVLIANDDPAGSRVFPPFQGNGGGASGGPLFKLKGRDIDILLHPTGVRPGTILQVGDTASFSGHIAPTLSSRYEIVVTAPSGARRTISGQANRIGYLYRPETDFRVDEAGVWRVRVKVWHEGTTSAGQVQAPFPTNETSFNFYVVDARAPQLELAPMPEFVRHASPIEFIASSSLAGAELHYTVTMPGFVLEEGSNRQLRYSYHSPTLAQDFPNLDRTDEDFYTGTDMITISLLLSGTDASGARKYLARQVIIDGEHLMMPAQLPAPAKRRTARR